jgi:ribonuclease H / adenosylcobalamin/alpha-ribazole phosphatase
MAAIGYVIVEGGSTLVAHGERIGTASAVVAEYSALLAGLRHAGRLGLDEVDVRSDCRLLISHLLGDLKPVNAKLVALGDEIAEQARQLRTVTFRWIPSADNTQAHGLVSDALAGRSATL